MSVSHVVADRYARALLGIVAGREDVLNQLDAELDLLATLWQADPLFAAFLQNPRILAADKQAVVRKVLGPQFSPTTLHLILLLIDKHRESILLPIAQRFSALADEARGVQEAQVITAVPLPPDQLARLEEKVQRFSNHEVLLQPKVDPAIVGGVVLRLGNRVIDGSLRFQLEEIRRTLHGTTVH